MASADGIAAIGVYGNGTVAADIAELVALIPDVDTTSTSGAQAGGGNLDEMSPIAAVQLRIELAEILANTTLDSLASGSHLVTAGEVTATQVDIVTGLANITLANGAVSIFRAGVNVTLDAAITESAPGTITIEDGAADYVLTAADKIVWLANA